LVSISFSEAGLDSRVLRDRQFHLIVAVVTAMINDWYQFLGLRCTSSCCLLAYLLYHTVLRVGIPMVTYVRFRFMPLHTWDFALSDIQIFSSDDSSHASIAHVVIM
jgi:hypothetical protein